MRERKEVLESLLQFENSYEQLRKELVAFPWDSDSDIARLSIAQVVSVLNRFIIDNKSASEVESWANAIEGRDDIGFESRSESILRDVIHELANPDLTQELTHERALELLKNLG